MAPRASVIQGVFPNGVARIAAAPAVQPKAAGRPQWVQQKIAVGPRAPAPLQRQTIHRVTPNGTATPLPPNLTNFGNSPGRPLPAAVRQKMEAVFGTNFADVRIHVGPQAGALGALAFTHGSDIHFASGRYDPHTSSGQRMLAHELAHVVQQRSGRVRNPYGGGVAIVHDAALEAEAERMAGRAAQTVQRSKMSDAEKMKARGERFAPELKANADEKAQKQKKAQALMDLVNQLIEDVEDKKIKFASATSATKHGYSDPEGKFAAHLAKAAAETTWVEVSKNGDVKVTLAIDDKDTVTGVRSGDTVTIIHCGPTASGSGYGTNLSAT